MTPPVKPEVGAVPPPAPPEQESYEQGSARMMAAFGKKKAGAPAARPAVLDEIRPEAAETTGAVLPSDRPKPDSLGKAAKGAAGFAGSVVKGAASIITHPFATTASAGRGVVSMVDDTAETLISLAASVVGADGDKAAEDATDFIDSAQDWIFGPRSGAPSQQFVEDTAQFITGFVGAGKFKFFAKLSKARPIVGGMAKGALVDFAAFDPHVEQLAELAASSDIPGIKGLGEILSVEEDDGPLVARFKRSAGGLIPGAAIDGLVAGARFLRASKVLKDPKATPAAVAAAEEVAATNGKILNDIDAGAHVPAEPVVVRPSDNGKWSMEIHPSWTEEFGNLDNPDAFVEAAAAAANARSGTPDLGTYLKQQQDDLRQLRQERKKFNVDFDSRWQAEQQAASINETLAVKMQANVKVTTESLHQIHGLAKAISDADGDPEQIVLLAKKTPFNFTYKDSPEKVTALLKSIGEVLTAMRPKVVSPRAPAGPPASKRGNAGARYGCFLPYASHTTRTPGVTTRSITRG